MKQKMKPSEFDEKLNEILYGFASTISVPKTVTAIKALVREMLPEKKKHLEGDNELGFWSKEGHNQAITDMERRLRRQ